MTASRPVVAVVAQHGASLPAPLIIGLIVVIVAVGVTMFMRRKR